MVQVKVAVVQVAPPGDAVAVYEVIGEPPVFRGADQVRATWVSFGLPTTFVGKSGGLGTILLRVDVDGPYPHLLADFT